ncbi:hypothetical protein [Tsukamurella ocularis]|uniref:hypothetical protein n=1 Tax=Tsukamurella ocularis TaxID=1970234 RepID=UPI00216A49FB|nr:hypothetical protein [Tsukamurella ocularis]MCS3779145.1 hypothetical protein [Tsukamurella ocularis]MCS3787235.1 hypothetical protein [Tsukamurella ocularis]MCS3852626.1 hypothetical protein [Tsukamurella ocularis]
MASPSDPPTDRAGDTEQFPVTRVSTAAATDTDDVPSTGGPAHAVSANAPGISRAGWWAITIAAAVVLVLGFLLTFGPARYWTPVPAVFLGYFLISGVIGLVFWKGVRELWDSNPTLHSGDGPATPGARVAAAIGAVGIASALIMLPVGLSDAPASAAPCPDGTNTCGPQPTMGPQPTQGNGGNTTAPQAPNTTVPGYTPPDTPPQQGSGSTPTVQGQVPTMPTGDSPSNGCIFNCGPTQAPQQAPQTGQATPPQTAQNPVTTAPNTPATTPQAPTTTARLRTPTPETTTSTTSSKARDRDYDQQRSSDEDREKNSPYPYQAALLSAVGGTYRRRRDGKVDPSRILVDPTTAWGEVYDIVQQGGWTQGPNLPDHSVDNATWNTWEIRGRDRLARTKVGVGMQGAALVLPQGSRGLQQYVGGTGRPLSISPEDLMADSAQYNKHVSDTVQHIISDMLARGTTGTQAFVSSWDGTSTATDSTDWHFLLGKFSTSISGLVNLKPDGSYTVSYVVHVYDYYDWKPGAPMPEIAQDVGLSAEDMFRLHMVGLAKNFETVGTSAVIETIGKVQPAPSTP